MRRGYGTVQDRGQASAVAAGYTDSGKRTGERQDGTADRGAPRGKAAVVDRSIRFPDSGFPGSSGGKPEGDSFESD